MKCLSFKSTLATCEIGNKFKIKQVLEGQDFKYQLRLFELGFLQGEEVFVKQKSLKQKTFLVEVRGITFVLQENLAKRVIVEDL